LTGVTESGGPEKKPDLRETITIGQTKTFQKPGGTSLAKVVQGTEKKLHMDRRITLHIRKKIQEKKIATFLDPC